LFAAYFASNAVDNVVAFAGDIAFGFIAPVKCTAHYVPTFIYSVALIAGCCFAWMQWCWSCGTPAGLHVWYSCSDENL
jgi:hypothetical protein